MLENFNDFNSLEDGLEKNLNIPEIDDLEDGDELENEINDGYGEVDDSNEEDDDPDEIAEMETFDDTDDF